MRLRNSTIAVVVACSLLLCGCNTINEALLVARKLNEPPETNGLTFANRNSGTPTRNDGDAINPDAVDAALKQLAGGTAPGEVCLLPGKPPEDQEISVNLVFAGAAPCDQGKCLDFDFKAFWGTYKSSISTISVPAASKKGVAKINLGPASLQVVPKIVSSTKGHYDVTLTDASGSLYGKFAITSSGDQVQLSGAPKRYSTKLIYFDAENRLTGFEIKMAGTNKTELGVIFVGKGWSFVENSKKADLSKGYLFPEVDMVVLPKAFFEDNEMKDTCSTLKRGTETVGGMSGSCYS